MPSRGEDTEWSVIKDLEPTVELEGTFAVVNVEVRLASLPVSDAIPDWPIIRPESRWTCG